MHTMDSSVRVLIISAVHLCRKGSVVMDATLPGCVGPIVVEIIIKEDIYFSLYLALSNLTSRAQ